MSMNLVFLSCFGIHSNSSYPTNELHIGLSIDAWNNQSTPTSGKTKGNESKHNGNIQINKVGYVVIYWPCDPSIYWATLRRRVSRNTSPCSFHLCDSVRVVSVIVIVIVTAVCIVFLVFLWWFRHESQWRRWIWERKMLREKEIWISPRMRRTIKDDNDIRGKRMESEEYGLAS